MRRIWGRWLWCDEGGDDQEYIVCSSKLKLFLPTQSAEANTIICTCVQARIRIEILIEFSCSSRVAGKLFQSLINQKNC